MALLVPVLLVASVCFGQPAAADPAPAGQIVYGINDGSFRYGAAVNPDGTDDHRVAPNSVFWLQFTRDASKLAFGYRGPLVGGLGGVQRDVYVINTDGTGRVNLTANNNTNDIPLAWSYDNSRIAFTSIRDGIFGVHVMNADGSDVHLIRENATAASFAPDGTKLVVGGAAGNEAPVAIHAVDGTLVRTLASTGFDPAWSPDGTRISYSPNGSELHTVNIDGTGGTLIDSVGGSIYGTAWSPDSSTLAYSMYVSSSCGTIPPPPSACGPAGSAYVYKTLAAGGPREIVAAHSQSNSDGVDWLPVAAPYVDIPLPTLPIVTGVPDRAPDSGDWYHDPVTITWDVTDPTDGPATIPPPTVVTTEGTDWYNSAPSCDQLGFCNTGVLKVKLDTVAPNFSVTGVVDGHSYYDNSYFTPSCNATDTTSGVASQGSVTVADNGGGSFTATCAGAADNAANISAPVSATYSLLPHTTPGGLLAFGGASSSVASDGTGLQTGLFPSGVRTARYAQDGSRILFSWPGPLRPARFELNLDAWIVNADGTGLTNLTPDDPYHDVPTDISPDNSLVAYWSASGATSGIYLINADGTGRRFIGPGTYARFSADGTRLLVSGGGLIPSPQTIVAYNLDGTSEPALTQGSWATWSPDGTKIAFVRNEQYLIVMNSDGTGEEVLDYSISGDFYGLAWSADGTEIAYELLSGSANLYRVTVLGGPRQLVATAPGSLAAHDYINWLPAASIAPVSFRLPVYPKVWSSLQGGVSENGWFRVPPTIVWRVEHPSGLAPVPPPTPVTIEGYLVRYFSAPSCSPDNDCGTGYLDVSYDATPPAVVLSGPSNGAVYPSGQAPPPACATTDSLSGVHLNAQPSTTDNGDGTFTSSCAGAIDEAGNAAGPVSVTYSVLPPDTVAPMVTGTPDRAPNGFGWYSAPVTVTWSATDPPPSAGTPSTPAPTNAATEGSNVIYTSDPSCDLVNNCATGSVTLSLDVTMPAVTVTGVQNGGRYLKGREPVPACTTTDALSGVDTSASVQVTSNGGGSFTATCSGAADRAGNAASAISVTYLVVPAMYSIATNTRTGAPASSITATVGSVGVPAGHTVTVAVATGATAGSVSCSDAKGNTYTVVATTSSGGGRVFVCSAPVTTALASGDVVTATYPMQSGATVISVNAIDALATAAVVDQTGASSGNSTSPQSGNVTTTAALDLVFGVISHNSTPTLTPAAGLTAIGAVSAGSGGSKRTLTPMFRLVSATGTYNVSGTLSSATQWRGAAIAYKPPGS